MAEDTLALLPASSIDRRLLKAAARYASPEEMSEAVLGKLTPAQCLERVNQILESKTAWDEVKERRLALVQIAEWLDYLKDQKDNPKAWGAINRATKLLSDQIERANVNVSDLSTKLAGDHAMWFVEGFGIGFERILKAIAERDMIEIPDEDIEELVEVGVKASQEYIDRVTVKAIEA